MDLFENLQMMNESSTSTYESEVDYEVLKQNDIDFFENGAGNYRVVTPDDDKLDIVIETQNDNGVTKWFVSLPSEDIRTVDSDLTSAILTVVNKISGPNFGRHTEDVEQINESTNEDFVKKECEKYGINKSSYGSGYMELYLEPTDDAAEKFINKIEADGYKFISKQEDGPKNSVFENDVTLIYGKEVEGNRCIIAISIHPSEDSVIVSCGYNEDESDNEFFESLQNPNEPEEIIEWDDDVFDDQYDDGEEKIEAAIVKDKKDIEQTCENKESLKEDLKDPKLISFQEKANKFGAMIDALGEEMSEYDLNEFLKGLTNELHMDVYKAGESYPSDIDGYFAQPVDELDLNDEVDAELYDWVDRILTDCIAKTKTFIESKIETLEGEISAIETDIINLKAVL